MTTEYHKIDAPFKRDKRGRMLMGEWCRDEFEYLADLRWEFTEKVDGTNIRIDIWRFEDSLNLYINGRTDNAQIPQPLLDALNGIFGGEGRTIYNRPDNRHPLTDKIGRIMVERDIEFMTIYGEGYGPKINGGGKYAEVPSFVVFDIKVGGFWLSRENVDDFCLRVGLDSVPVLGYGTLRDAFQMVRYGTITVNGVILNVNEDGAMDRLSSRWGDFEAEGIIAVPEVPLFNRQGNRIITKIKAKDFRRDDD